MKRLIRWLAILGVLGLIGVGASVPAMDYMKEQCRVHYREVEVSRGKIVAVVNATGTIKPVRSIQVGAFTSGPIDKVFVNYNEEVKKGQLLAKIDPKLANANVDREV